MSASLVGSEMCIRDSFFRLRIIWGAAGSVVRHEQTHCTCGSLLPLDCWPVSYTHLTLPTICSV
eukprot:10879023-Alexandrium_andersonii.AAC.1